MYIVSRPKSCKWMLLLSWLLRCLWWWTLLWEKAIISGHQTSWNGCYILRITSAIRKCSEAHFVSTSVCVERRTHPHNILSVAWNYQYRMVGYSRGRCYRHGLYLGNGIDLQPLSLVSPQFWGVLTSFSNSCCNEAVFCFKFLYLKIKGSF